MRDRKGLSERMRELAREWWENEGERTHRESLRDRESEIEKEERMGESV